MPRKKSNSSKKQSLKTKKSSLKEETNIKIRTLTEDQEKINFSETSDHIIENNFIPEEKPEEKLEPQPELQTKDEKLSNEQLDVEENKYIAVFSYLSFLFIIPLFLKRESPFCQKHAKQGLVWFTFQLITSIFYFIPIINIFYGLIILTITLNSFIQTMLGKYWRIPFLYKWAEKINL